MTDTTSLVALIDSLADGRVLCIGDVMLDRYTYGEVSRISAEAPIPVCRVIDEKIMLGGAGNVARNLLAVGAAVDFVTVVGVDAAGDQIRDFFQSLDRIEAKLIDDETRQTTIKDRFIVGVQQLLRVDRESTETVNAVIAGKVQNYAEGALAGAGAVVISDYGKGVLSGDAIGLLVKKARKMGTQIVIDPKGDDFTRYAGADIITPNQRELADASRLPINDNVSVVEAARFIAHHCNIGNVLVTRGSDGMTLVTASDAVHLPSEARDVFDVSGAGDTVVAILAAAIAAGASLFDAARLSNVAAGIVVGKIGTAVAYPHDIVDAVHRQALTTPGISKVLPLASALDRIAGWRRRGDKVGFTNGCFDLIHPGHVALLAKARSACDRLVVGLNDDESVRRLKGEHRPVQNAASRAAVLASLETVDLVLLFAEDTPITLIEAIKPDLLAKGADYTLDEVVGAGIVQTTGGEVLLVELEEGHSTSATIARLAK